MPSEEQRDFWLRMRSDCDFFRQVADIEDPAERQKFVHEQGYRSTPQEILKSVYEASKDCG